MAGVERKSLDSPDESRTPDKLRMDVVDVGGVTAWRSTFFPGWRWSESIKPIVGGDSCQVHHLGVLLSGRMHVAHSDGSEADINAGDVYNIEPGHDGWVVGDEAAIGVEFDPWAAADRAKS